MTTTNPGSYGDEGVALIVNPPQIAVLGGRVLRNVPALRDGGRREAQVMHLSLTFGHAVADGAPATRFLVGPVTSPANSLDIHTATSRSKESG